VSICFHFSKMSSLTEGCARSLKAYAHISICFCDFVFQRLRAAARLAARAVRWRARGSCVGRWRRDGSRSEGGFIAILLSAVSMFSRE